MAKKGFGVVAEYSLDSGTTWVAIANLKDAVPPSYSKDMIDTTHHGTADGVRTKRGGLVDGGDASLVVQYDATNAGHQALRTRAETANDDPIDFRFTYPEDSATDSFSAVVGGFEYSSPMDGIMEATISLSRSGKSTYATA